MAFKYKEVETAKAKKTPGKSMKPVGKKPKLGSGKRFAALESAIAKKKGVSNPKAVAAAIGAKKYGSAKMHKMATAGRMKAKAKKGSK